jgi:NAD(P)-dependent dehydrogenase (short-subunit alcohol dehydrogenase family)
MFYIVVIAMFNYEPLTRCEQSMSFSLSNRRALVVGAGGGIGEVTSQVLAELGAQVVLVDRAAPKDLADRIVADGGSAVALQADVVNEADRNAVLRDAGALDILVYLAAICPWDDWTDPGWDDVFDDVMDVNLKAPTQMARSVMPGMAARGWGRIVLVGSVAGRLGGLIAGPHYVASKGGLHALVKWLAQRGGPQNVLVNGVAPASTDTAMIAGKPVDLTRIPLRRKSRPEEIAWPIAFLCSPAASYICGTILDVNGGVLIT